jgi:hypothetical protein
MKQVKPAKVPLVRRVTARATGEVLGWHFSLGIENGIVTIDEHGYQTTMTEQEYKEALKVIRCK